jgi:hypothetical protein
VGTFFLNFFCGGIVSCFSAETTMSANVGGVRKSEGVPEHENHKWKHTIHERRGDKESPKVCTRLKSCEPLYMCPRAPFIGRRRDFYIPRLPLESRKYS